MALFTIWFSAGVKEDMAGLRAYDRRMVLDAIEAHLSHAPSVATKHRKLLHNLVPPFEAVPPVWQLRAGAFRVLYDVSAEERRVYVRAVRRKPAHRRTEDILSMKTISVRELQKRIRDCVKASQRDRVVVTRHGIPTALIIGVNGTDWDTLALQTHPSFWRLIERRRTEPVLSMAAMKKLTGSAKS